MLDLNIVIKDYTKNSYKLRLPAIAAAVLLVLYLIVIDNNLITEKMFIIIFFHVGWLFIIVFTILNYNKYEKELTNMVYKYVKSDYSPNNADFYLLLDILCSYNKLGDKYPKSLQEPSISLIARAQEEWYEEIGTDQCNFLITTWHTPKASVSQDEGSKIYIRRLFTLLLNRNVVWTHGVNKIATEYINLYPPENEEENLLIKTLKHETVREVHRTNEKAKYHR